MFTQLGLEEVETNNLSGGTYNIAMSFIQYRTVLNKKNFTISKCENSLAKCYAASGKKIEIKIIITCNYYEQIVYTSIVFEYYDKYYTIFLLYYLAIYC